MTPTPEFRDLPAIDALLADAGALIDRYGRTSTAAALRHTVEKRRAAMRAGEHPATDHTSVLVEAAADLAARRPGPPRAVLNASGVVVHTNLGRAPLSPDAVQAVTAAAGYCDLETDLDSGGRGSREARLEPLIADACGAEAGIAVNNAAGALVLVLAALAAGREVLVSRGELVEIGGSFRLPEIMAASGARLVEVGTTNRTRATDFADAGDDVALILSVHPSNYRIEGFAEAPGLDELAEVAASRAIPLVHDAGSGLLDARTEPWLQDEPDLQGALHAGADVVLASGDKLLGGPQAGLLAGRRLLVRRCSRHPLARALRLDKLRIAALASTLQAHLAGEAGTLPVWAMLDADVATLQQRATGIAAALGGSVEDGVSLVGGGAAPGRTIPTPVVRVSTGTPDELARRLRLGDPAIVARVDAGALWLDPRTLHPADDEVVIRRVADEL